VTAIDVTKPREGKADNKTASVSELIDRLAAFQPQGAPVLSLYLDARPDEHGQARYQPFLRKELPARAAGLRAHSPERASYEHDSERIRGFVARELSRSANGAALFCCSAAELFEAVQLEAPLGPSFLHVGARPHVYPLVRLLDRYPRYAALVADTNLARLFVFGLQLSEGERVLASPKAKRSDVGGWSQLRYQRHVDDMYRRHAKEVVAMLERTVREEDIDRIVLAGDEVIVPLLRGQLPRPLADKVAGVVPLDIRTPEHQVLAQTLDALRRRSAQSEAARVEQLFDDYRAGGLAVVGVRATEAALRLGQAHELLLTAAPAGLRELDPALASAGESAAGAAPATPEQTELADRLVTLARQSAATVSLIEDPRLLANVGGAGATLRYHLKLSSGEARQA
jgi:peptide chain release factor subunit 1